MEVVLLTFFRTRDRDFLPNVHFALSTMFFILHRNLGCKSYVNYDAHCHFTIAFHRRFNTKWPTSSSSRDMSLSTSRIELGVRI